MSIYIFMQAYDQWSEMKQQLNTLEPRDDIFIHRKQIWYVKLGMNIGSEENGKREFRRPVLVVNKIGNVYFCLPLTTKGRDDHRFYHRIESIDFWKRSHLILSQWRVLDQKRFLHKIWEVSQEEFKEIRKKLARFYC